MNIEYEVKDILRSGGNPKKVAEQICRFTSFNEKDIVKAIEMGGRTVSDVYGNLIKFDRKKPIFNFQAKKDNLKRLKK